MTTNTLTYHSKATTHKAPNQDIIIINNFTDFERLHKSWDNLSNLQISQSIFNSHNWVKSSWAWYEKQGVPNIIAIYNNQDLIAIIPLVIISKNKKNILKFLDNPLTQFNDFLIHPLYTDHVFELFFQLLNKWGQLWDEIDLEAIPTTSLLYKKLHYSNENQIPFKYKIIVDKKSSYIPLRILGNTWDKWLSKQSTSAYNSYQKLVDTYSANFNINRSESNSDINNTTSLRQLINLIDQLAHNNKLAKSDKQHTINSFLKRFGYYNKEQKWLNSFDWYHQGKYIASQYLLNDNGNIYYLSTQKVTGLTPSAKKYLQSMILKQCLETNANRFFFADKLHSWQKIWHIEKEPLFKIKIYNKSRKWF